MPQETALCKCTPHTPCSKPMPVSACKASPGKEHSCTLRSDSSYFHISFTPVILRPQPGFLACLRSWFSISFYHVLPFTALLNKSIQGITMAGLLFMCPHTSDDTHCSATLNLIQQAARGRPCQKATYTLLIRLLSDFA